MVDFIKVHYNLDYTINGVTKLLHRLGFVYKQTVLIPGTLDEQAQAKFKKNYEKLRGTVPKGEGNKIKVDWTHYSRQCCASF